MDATSPTVPGRRTGTSAMIRVSRSAESFPAKTSVAIRPGGVRSSRAGPDVSRVSHAADVDVEAAPVPTVALDVEEARRGGDAGVVHKPAIGRSRLTAQIAASTESGIRYIAANPTARSPLSSDASRAVSLDRGFVEVQRGRRPIRPGQADARLPPDSTRRARPRDDCLRDPTSSEFPRSSGAPWPPRLHEIDAPMAARSGSTPRSAEVPMSVSVR